MWRSGELLGSGPSAGPISYRIPLFEYAERLPADLLETGMSWVWESVGQGPDWPAHDPELPNRKELTELTSENAPIFTREFSQHDGEHRRWFASYGGHSELLKIASDRGKLRTELEAFSESRSNCLAAVMLQVGDSPYEEFVVSRTPSQPLQQLLQVWCKRLGTRVDKLSHWSGRTLLGRTLLRE